MKKIKKIERENVNDDFVIYVDTDSLFFSPQEIIKTKYPEISIDDNEKMVPAILEISKDIQNYVNKSMDYFASKFLSISSHRFSLKQEIVARSGFWTTKKRYALWAINIEGRDVDELEVKGLDVVRSSFPSFYRDFMKKTLKEILMGDTKEKIDKEILQIKRDTKKVNFIEISRPTGVKEYSKFSNNSHQPFTFNLKGTPVHVKSAINYNDFLRHHGLENKFSFIGDNEKIKWVYLQNNPFGLDSMAFKDNDEDPQEILDYIEKYIDRDKIFNSEMEKKLQDFYNALNWGNLPTKSYNELSKFF